MCLPLAAALMIGATVASVGASIYSGQQATNAAKANVQASQVAADQSAKNNADLLAEMQTENAANLAAQKNASDSALKAQQEQSDTMLKATKTQSDATIQGYQSQTAALLQAQQQAAQQLKAQQDAITQSSQKAKPAVQTYMDANRQDGAGGVGSTMLTGPQGVDASTLLLGKNTLLGS